MFTLNYIMDYIMVSVNALPGFNYDPYGSLYDWTNISIEKGFMELFGNLDAPLD